MKALLPVFDESRKKPYYLQLYSYIRDAILAGEISSDVSKNITVEEAAARDLGFVVSDHNPVVIKVSLN